MEQCKPPSMALLAWAMDRINSKSAGSSALKGRPVDPDITDDTIAPNPEIPPPKTHEGPTSYLLSKITADGCTLRNEISQVVLHTPNAPVPDSRELSPSNPAAYQLDREIHTITIRYDIIHNSYRVTFCRQHPGTSENIVFTLSKNCPDDLVEKLPRVLALVDMTYEITPAGVTIRGGFDDDGPVYVPYSTRIKRFKSLKENRAIKRQRCLPLKREKCGSGGGLEVRLEGKLKLRVAEDHDDWEHEWELLDAEGEEYENVDGTPYRGPFPG